MQVSIVLGSRSQWSTMQHTAKLLASLGISHEVRIITANKSTNQLQEYASKAIERGLEVIITCSTDATYLPGIITLNTDVPVLSMRTKIATNKKNASARHLLANPSNTIEMLHNGIEGAINAAILAASLLANSHPRILRNLNTLRHQNNLNVSLINTPLDATYS